MTPQEQDKARAAVRALMAAHQPKKLSRAELGHIIGYSPDVIANILTSRTNVSGEFIDAIRKAFNLSERWPFSAVTQTFMGLSPERAQRIRDLVDALYDPDLAAAMIEAQRKDPNKTDTRKIMRDLVIQEIGLTEDDKP